MFEQVPLLDEEGNPVLDEFGQPVMVDGNPIMEIKIYPDNWLNLAIAERRCAYPNHLIH